MSGQNNVRDVVTFSQEKDSVNAKRALESVLYTKVSEALQLRKSQIQQSYFQDDSNTSGE
jgi:hypothetical protein